MSEQQAEPSPEAYGEYDDWYYDVAQWIATGDEDDLLEYDYRTKQAAVDEAALLNEMYSTDRYRAVRVDKRVQWRAVKESDR